MRTFKKILIVTGILILLILILSSVAYIYAPLYLEKVLIPAISRNAGINDLHCKIPSLTAYHTALSNIRIPDDNGKPALSINSVGIDYTPSDLIKKHINKIVISGVHLHVAYKDNRFIIAGLNPDSLRTGRQPAEEKFKMPLSIGSFEVENAMVILDWNDNSLVLPLRFHAEISKTGSFCFKLYNETTENKIIFKDQRINYTGNAPGFNITGKGSIKNNDIVIDSSFFINFKNSNLSASNGKITIPDYILRGKVNYQKGKLNIITKAEIEKIKCDLAGTSAEINGITITFPFIQPYILTTIEFFKVNCYALVQIFEVVLPNINTSGYTKSLDGGTIQLKQILYNNNIIGSIHGNIKQKPSGINLRAILDSNLLPDLKVKFKGTSSFTAKQPVELNFGVNIDYSSEETVSLEKLINLLPEHVKTAVGNMTFAGQTKIDSNLEFNNKSINSKLAVNMKNSVINLKDHEITLNGLNLKLNFADLKNFRSEPNQFLSFENINFGNLNLGKSKTEFQVESKKSLFIEKGIYEWCGGHIYTQSMRITPDKKDYQIHLFCDRLNLAELLNQFDIVKAEGNGTVSGIITIDIINGDILFKDSILYSSPGDSGIIKLTNTEMLTAGIPKNSSQYKQIELAGQALSCFNYNWVKLYLTTKDKDCIVKLSLSGSPSKPLQFARGKLITKRIQVKGGKAAIQPMMLDLNLKIPLNKLIHYHNGIKNFISRR